MTPVSRKQLYVLRAALIAALEAVEAMLELAAECRALRPKHERQMR